MLSRVMRGSERVVLLGAQIAAAACLAMVVNVAADVAGRSLFNHPVDGTIEMVAYIWMPTVSLAFGYAQLRDEQIRVTLLLEWASSKVARILTVLAEAVALALALWIFYILLGEAQDSYAIGERVPSKQWIPIWGSHYVLVAAYVLMAIGAAHRIVSIVTKVEDPFTPEIEIEGRTL
ncbi:TRAP transporter small permease [Rhodococcus sp. T2V]|uniref:TRAP transporter small permease n=1 Tax=Rhodococcus sp. T2V TaxID=3034164 RepID=UPI0023E1B96A|nr:TRAP transporter small permease [Rhodococcus sp. T2V]MDF3309674.1 TRAP transporter small permease [Rhodococcus sp. T2V]